MKATIGFGCCVVALILFCNQCNGNVQNDKQSAEDTSSESPKTSIIHIIVEPMVYHPVEWKSGERVTVGVHVKSGSTTRVIGILSDIELVAVDPHENRFDMLLRSSAEDIAKIRAAADISEYWFMVTPFKEEHRKLVSKEPEVADFLAKNDEFRPADGSQWGFNSRSNERLPRPSKQELPIRRDKSDIKPADSGM
ncbi:MAG: hypothetical protein KDA52_13965 [Planctomycetaceae bacterium]|nr:hypothetical protein [Planctomycetaceae bacterium]